jgi:hypothetical protein
VSDFVATVIAMVSFRCSLEQTVIVSWAFRGRGRSARLARQSRRYAMKGIARPEELFTLDPG